MRNVRDEGNKMKRAPKRWERGGRRVQRKSRENEKEIQRCYIKLMRLKGRDYKKEVGKVQSRD